MKSNVVQNNKIQFTDFDIIRRIRSYIKGDDIQFSSMCRYVAFDEYSFEFLDSMLIKNSFIKAFILLMSLSTDLLIIVANLLQSIQSNLVQT